MAEKKAVICFETGERFESASAAARRLGVNPSRIFRSIANGWAVYGLHFHPEGEERSADDFAPESKGGGRKKAVVCFETGERFESASAAARRLGVETTRISGAMRKGHAVHGLHFHPEGEEPCSESFSKRGKRGGRRVPVVCFETGERFESMAAAARHLGTDTRRISAAVSRGQAAKGLHFHLEDEERTAADFARRGGGNAKIPVICFETGERFGSMSEAARHLGISVQQVFSAVRGRRTAKGLHFHLEGDEPDAEDFARSRGGRAKIPVVCFETGERFESMAAAARHLGVNFSNVSAAVRNRGAVRGLHFHRDGEERTAADFKAHGKGVRCVETGAVYESISAASRASGVAAAGISAAMKGTAGGLHWEPAEADGLQGAHAPTPDADASMEELERLVLDLYRALAPHARRLGGGPG